MPNWLTSTLTTLPAHLWIIFGLGLPWVLVALPRRDWRDRLLISGVALAFGPALLTAWMFVLGTLGQNSNIHAGDLLNPMQTRIQNLEGGQAFLTPTAILLGTVILAGIGWLLVWHKARTTTQDTSPRQPLAWDEKTLIGLVIIGTVGRWIISSWLTFGSWDPLWVYGYQSRIYTLLGYIPTDIGYYPQFMQLQYAFGQIIHGGWNDHAARAALPLPQIGSILMAYVLGSRLFNRRTGIYAAALWGLYPHFAYWTRVADLEIPVTFSFTGAAAFFLMAWLAAEPFYRRRYAIISGLFLGVAMWTKPTAGAFIWGVVLLVVVDFIRVRGDWRRWWPRFEVAFYTGIACIPLGGLWYLRNILIGHEPVTFPPSLWLSRALRSGQEFGWPLLALTLLIAYLLWGPLRHRPNWRGIALGMVLVIAGVLPTILQPDRMSIVEWALLAAGSGVLAWTLIPYARQHATEHATTTIITLAWAGLLALPYFITWFYSYSYHYRLSFAIVPLMILPTAVILGAWFTTERINTLWSTSRRSIYSLLLISISLPGVMMPIYDQNAGWDWLWTRPDPDDFSQAALLGVVDYFEEYTSTHEEAPVIIAPGMQTLPFFFPQADIRITDTPVELSQLDGVTHFILASPETYEFYERMGIQQDYPGQRIAFQTQLFTSLFRENVTQSRTIYEDPGYSYVIYEIDSQARFEPPPPPLVALEDEVIFGEFVRLVGYSYADTTLDYAPETTDLHFVFEVIAPPPDDYLLYVHLVTADDINTPFAQADGPVKEAYQSPEYYSTRFWELDEYIIDRRLFYYTPFGESDDSYQMRIGFYSQTDGHRAAVTVNGEEVGDGYLLETAFTVPAPPQ